MKPQSLEHELLYPTLLALDAMGGSGGIRDIDAWVVEHERFGEEVTTPLQGNGPRTVFEYRMAWARTILKKLGLVASGGRAVWIITDAGVRLLERPRPEEVLRQLNQARRQTQTTLGFEAPVFDELPLEDNEVLSDLDNFAFELEEEESWKSALLRTLMTLTPRGFEHLTLRLLREHGIENLSVLGGPSDGGIDGEGFMRLGLLRFPIVFQCKRYSESVGSAIVRDFRGAMQGRTDKGLLITTSRFTRDAISEATRPGTNPIDLIDGDQLCQLMRDTGLGIRTKIALDETFFEDYRDL